MPTWRNYLVTSMTTDSASRDRIDTFRESSFFAHWRDLIASSELARLAAEGYDIVFMPHPNMRLYLDDFDVPAHVRVVSYSDINVRELLVSAAVLVTDYSSMAFNAAYLDIPVAYFQFDQEEYRAKHTERSAYFAYETHGFGPVCETIEQAERAIASAAVDGLGDEYRERIARTFPVRDGGNRQRVYEAMREAAVRRPLSERVVASDPDTWGDE